MSDRYERLRWDCEGEAAGDPCDGRQWPDLLPSQVRAELRDAGWSFGLLDTDDRRCQDVIFWDEWFGRLLRERRFRRADRRLAIAVILAANPAASISECRRRLALLGHRVSWDTAQKDVHAVLGTEPKSPRERRPSLDESFIDERGRKFLGRPEILAVYQDPRPARVVARDYGVAPTTVYRIRTGRQHAKLTGASP